MTLKSSKICFGTIKNHIENVFGIALFSLEKIFCLIYRTIFFSRTVWPTTLEFCMTLYTKGYLRNYLINFHNGGNKINFLDNFPNILKQCLMTLFLSVLKLHTTTLISSIPYFKLLNSKGWDFDALKCKNVAVLLAIAFSIEITVI